MKLVLWIKGERGLALLRAVRDAGYAVAGLVLEPGDADSAAEARRLGIAAVTPRDPHDAATLRFLRSADADVFVLNGYRRILRNELIALPRIMCINLHGGKLPEYRGSSPMNWALINGERSFTLSVIRLDEGIDTGPVLAEKRFAVSRRHTIRDLHATANEEFPRLALRVLAQLKRGRIRARRQADGRARYFPARFPGDGLIVWDMQTAEEIHNRIRALTEPYPCAYTFWGDRKVRLLASEWVDPPFFGEPGRIYAVEKKSILVGASDRCLRVLEARFENGSEPVFKALKRYQSFRTCRSVVEQGAGGFL